LENTSYYVKTTRKHRAEQFYWLRFSVLPGADILSSDPWPQGCLTVFLELSTIARSCVIISVFKSARSVRPYSWSHIAFLNTQSSFTT